MLPAIDDPYTAGQNLVPPLRSMVVYVDRTLQARTVLSNPGTPLVFNAALICPYVVNVIPQQFTVINEDHRDTNHSAKFASGEPTAAASRSSRCWSPWRCW